MYHLCWSINFIFLKITSFISFVYEEIAEISSMSQQEYFWESECLKVKTTELWSTEMDASSSSATS